jgi:hypothetical protein
MQTCLVVDEKLGIKLPCSVIFGCFGVPPQGRPIFEAVRNNDSLNDENNLKLLSCRNDSTQRTTSAAECLISAIVGNGFSL